MDNLKNFYGELSGKDFTDDCFIAVYIHSAKQYCDEEFFKTLLESNIGNAQISIVDNSIGLDYYSRVIDIVQKYKKENVVNITHIDVPRDDPQHQFLINVTSSLTELRQQFLATSSKYFVILEADIKPINASWLYFFEEVIDRADIIGGLYYDAFRGHTPDCWAKEAELMPIDHVLSGITLYKREFIEEIPFRWSLENTGAFPDAWACYDVARSIKNKWRMANYTKIRADHLTNTGGQRGHDKIN